MKIQGDARVGIGTGLPEAKLHIVMPRGSLPPSTVGGLVIEDNLFNSGNQVEIRDEAGNARVVVDGAGQVGIGTADPEAALEVSGETIFSSGVGFGAAPFYALTGAYFIDIYASYYQSGIRLYDDAGLKHTIYNSGGSSDILRLEPDGTGMGGGININQQGYVGIGTGVVAPPSRLTVKGNIALLSETDDRLIAELGEGLDYAEGFDIAESKEQIIEPGAVLVIDPRHPGKLSLSSEPYDTKVAGIVAGASGLGSGVRLGADRFDHDVALAGRVYCKVDATGMAVHPGDLLTTANLAGHAMRADDYTRAQGAILGKAMESLEKGQTGEILVLVTLQ